jgi:hypothetical protein
MAHCSGGRFHWFRETGNDYQCRQFNLCNLTFFFFLKSGFVFWSLMENEIDTWFWAFVYFLLHCASDFLWFYTNKKHKKEKHKHKNQKKIPMKLGMQQKLLLNSKQWQFKISKHFC